MGTTRELTDAADRLREAVGRLHFAPPVAFVYSPLDYAREPHHRYLAAWGAAPKKIVFLGMNPGPWGMAQCGVPFGSVSYVRDWLRIDGRVGKPAPEHPARPVTGFACKRAEVSGARLWGYFSTRFGTAEEFFRDHFVANYCPLAFLESSGANRTPDKLPADEQRALFAACDEHLRRMTEILEPQWVIGVGGFAAQRARDALSSSPVRVGSVLHPSPASPLANRGWAAAMEKQMRQLGAWR